jgi:hypothetical protein
MMILLSRRKKAEKEMWYDLRITGGGRLCILSRRRSETSFPPQVVIQKHDAFVSYHGSPNHRACIGPRRYFFSSVKAQKHFQLFQMTSASAKGASRFGIV